MAPPAADAPLRAPRAAAIAGRLFSTRLITSVLLVRWSIPYDPPDAGAWLAARSGTVAPALSLAPLSGVAFPWFIGLPRPARRAHRLRQRGTPGRARSLRCRRGFEPPGASSPTLGPVST